MSTCSQSNKDRIFVFDVDGTLTNEPTLLSPSLVSTISALAKQNLVIFATGRPYFGLSSIFLQIETLLPSVVLNGGGISLSDGVCSYGDPLNFNGLYTLSQKLIITHYFILRMTDGSPTRSITTLSMREKCYARKQYK